MKTLPLAKAVLLLAFVLLSAAFLYVGRPFLVPIGYALLLSIAMTPLCRRLERWGASRGLAVSACVLLLLLLILGIVSVLSMRIVNVAQDFVQLQDQIFHRLDRFENYITQLTHWSQARQLTYLKSQTTQLLGMVSAYMQSLLTSAALTLVEFGLILFYIFCLMYYRERFEQFLLAIVPDRAQKRARTVEVAVGEMTYQYLSGRLLVLLIQGVIYYVGFLLVGAPYPLFFAILGAIFNIIPYIGAVLAGLFPLLMALLTGSLFNIVGIAVVSLGNHLFESNFLTPKIVGAKVRLNPLFTVLTVVIGDLVWGIAGMILFIPLLGVIKIICDNFESLRPYGLLIGDEGADEKKVRMQENQKAKVKTA